MEVVKLVYVVKAEAADNDSSLILLENDRRKLVVVTVGVVWLAIWLLLRARQRSDSQLQ